jgi:hypothetical protein
MKNYYIRADLGDGIPSYDFVIRAKTLINAENKAWKILRQDYSEVFTEKRFRTGDFSICEITAEELLKRLTLN